ncbi:flagellar biosynthesis protein FlhB [Desulfurobacterium thermolithotrophum]|uniref:flagellar biosynthesis protein FlhB n=1 Tax=Desulfurobacterium thermolithotrophum TaxID=64160 RepID=UPI0013D406C8|nr:flagellar biosynthesis protein FlhB [Desulfurobacterium thermolithotrophum]
MAKDPSKTEKATPRRRQKAKEEGQVLKSQDIPIAFTLLITSTLLYFYIPFAYKKLLQLFTFDFRTSNNINLWNNYLVSAKTFALLILPVFLVLFLGGIFSNIIQFGFLFSLKPLLPKLDNINPIKGLGRLFSLKTLFETFRNTLKLIIALAVGYFSGKYILSDFFFLSFISLNNQIILMLKYTLLLFFIFGLLSLPIAAADFLFRRWEYEENLKMSKEEIKEERKQYEGHPLIKSAIRRKQREIAMKRMMAEIPKADVVITNPTHYAVALRYERGKMHAPKVIAKGVDSIALKIKEIALEHNIPIEENPYLARALYESCDIGSFIPEEFYQAIAKILAKVYKKKKLF